MNYEMKAMSYSVNSPNDHILFVVFQDDGMPIDDFKVYREGDRYKVRGQWESFSDAEDWAKQKFSKWNI